MWIDQKENEEKKFQHFALLIRYLYESAKDNGSCLGKETEVQV